MAKAHCFPAQADIESHSRTAAIIILNERGIVGGDEVSCGIAEGGLQCRRCSTQEVLKRRERVAGAGRSTESKRTANRKVVEAIQLILNGFTTHAQAVLPAIIEKVSTML